MKDYKKLVPIVLVFLMGISIYSRVSQVKEKKESLAAFMQEARDYREKGIVQEAVKSYKMALDLEYNIDICLEVGELLAENELKSDAVEWGEDMKDSFPSEDRAYSYLFKQYYNVEQYEKCFSLYDEAKKRKVVNSDLQDAMNKVEYYYKIDGSSYDDVSIFSGGYCAVKTGDFWGYASSTGNLEIDETFKEAGAFSPEGFAAVLDEQGEWQYITTEGYKRYIVQNMQQCKHLGLFSEDMLAASNGTTYSYYTKEFEKKLSDYKYASTMNRNVAAVQLDDGTWALINEKGEKLTQLAYEKFVLDEKEVAFRNDRAFALKDSAYSMVDEKGNEIPTPVLEDARVFKGSEYAAVKVNGKWGFIDKDGTMVIEAQYEDAHSFSNGMAAVRVNGTWGFINMDGKLIIDTVFEGVKDFNDNGCVFVETNSKWRALTLYKYNH